MYNLYKSLKFMSASRHLHRLLHAAVFRLQGWSMLLLAVPGMSSHACYKLFVLLVAQRGTSHLDVRSCRRPGQTALLTQPRIPRANSRHKLN